LIALVLNVELICVVDIVVVVVVVVVVGGAL